MRELLLPISLAMVCLLTCRTLPAQEEADQTWGDLTGTFLCDGPIPEPVMFMPRPGVRIRDESLVVGKMGGIKNVVVTLHRERGEEPPPIHDSYDEAAKREIALDFTGFRLKPHIALLRTTQSLVLSNKDAVGHGFRLPAVDNYAIAQVLPPGEKRNYSLRARERLPILVSNPIHPWITGVVVVQDHPYMAVTDDRGAFTLGNLPTGEWTFRFWHEKVGGLEEITRDRETLDCPGGRLTVAIAAGENRLGTFRLPAKQFAPRR
ncbi:MAG: hypothetical protein RIC55_30805 [Pirellulaceae bacterium]